MTFPRHDGRRKRTTRQEEEEEERKSLLTGKAFLAETWMMTLSSASASHQPVSTRDQLQTLDLS